MKLAIDIDGVLADFNSSYVDLLRKVSGRDLFSAEQLAGLNVTYPTTWNYDEALGYTREEVSAVWEAIKTDKNFWFKLKPLDGAKGILRQLAFLNKDGHDVYFFTNRMGWQAKNQTERWLYEHGCQYPTVILTAEKSQFIKDIGINFFIDDKPDTVFNLYVRAYSERWLMADKFFYLLNAPYNQEGRYPGCLVANSPETALKEVGLWRMDALSQGKASTATRVSLENTGTKLLEKRGILQDAAPATATTD